MPRPNKGPRLGLKRGRPNYYVRWTEAGRSRERSTGTADRREAEGVLAEFIQQRGVTWRPRDPREFPVIDALEIYGTERAPNTADPARIGHAITALTSFWGESFIGDVNDHTCMAYEEFRNRAPGTVRRELGTLRAAVNHAVVRGRLTRAVPVRLPEKPPGKDRWLDRNEVAAVLRAARGEPKARLHLPLFILTALYTGARKEAVLSLRWPQVDLEASRINFNPPGRTQTKKKRPVVPIPRRLMTFLKYARQRGSDMGYVINIDGERIGDIKHSFATACRKASLENVTPNTLRHTAGTWMAKHGVPMIKIGQYLGHTEQRTTELYAHHHPDFLKDAMEAFN